MQEPMPSTHQQQLLQPSYPVHSVSQEVPEEGASGDLEDSEIKGTQSAERSLKPLQDAGASFPLTGPEELHAARSDTRDHAQQPREAPGDPEGDASGDQEDSEIKGNTQDTDQSLKPLQDAGASFCSSSLPTPGPEDLHATRSQEPQADPQADILHQLLLLLQPRASLKPLEKPTLPAPSKPLRDEPHEQPQTLDSNGNPEIKVKMQPFVDKLMDDILLLDLTEECDLDEFECSGKQVLESSSKPNVQVEFKVRTLSSVGGRPPDTSSARTASVQDEVKIIGLSEEPPSATVQNKAQIFDLYEEPQSVTVQNEVQIIDLSEKPPSAAAQNEVQIIDLPGKPPSATVKDEVQIIDLFKEPPPATVQIFDLAEEPPSATVQNEVQIIDLPEKHPSASVKDEVQIIGLPEKPPSTTVKDEVQIIDQFREPTSAPVQNEVQIIDLPEKPPSPSVKGEDQLIDLSEEPPSATVDEDDVLIIDLSEEPPWELMGDAQRPGPSGALRGTAGDRDITIVFEGNFGRRLTFSVPAAAAALATRPGRGPSSLPRSRPVSKDDDYRALLCGLGVYLGVHPPQRDRVGTSWFWVLCEGLGLQAQKRARDPSWSDGAVGPPGKRMKLSDTQ